MPFTCLAYQFKNVRHPTYMSKEDHSESLTIRVPKMIKEMIEADTGIDKEYRTVTEWVVMAIREFEKQRLDTIAKRKQIQQFSESGTLDESDFTGSPKNNIHGKMKLD